MKSFGLFAFLGAFLQISSGASIVELAQGEEDLSTLVELLVQFPDLVDALSGSGQFTVFAPTNAAFAAAGVDTDNKDLVKEVLKYHVIAGAAVFKKDISRGDQQVETLQGDEVTVTKTLLGKIKVASNKAEVVTADVAADNGVVHIVNKVLALPAAGQNIVQLAQGSGDLTTLVSLLVQFDDLVQALSGDGPFTVFAPTNDAFNAAGIDASNKELVREVLEYHVIAGTAVFAGDISRAKPQTATTVQGAEVTVKKAIAGAIKVASNEAKVVQADLRATNGVVHVVDAVLQLPGGSGLDDAESASSKPTMWMGAALVGAFTLLQPFF